MKLKQIAALVLVGAMLTTTVFADTYDIGEGSITVNVDETAKTTVKVGDTEAKEDSGTVVITGTTTEHDVTITAAQGKDVEVTFRDVNITYTKGDRVVDVSAPGGTATLNFEGANVINAGGNNGIVITTNNTEADIDLVLKGDENSSLVTDGIQAVVSGDIMFVAGTEITVEDMNLDCTYIHESPTNGGGTLTVNNSKVNTGIIYIEPTETKEADTTITTTIKDSEVTVADGKFQDGLYGIVTDCCTNNNLTVDNSTLILDSNNESATAIQVNGQSATITLTNCGLEDSTQSITTSVAPDTGLSLTTVSNANGDPAYATVISPLSAPAPVEDKTLADMFTVKSAEGFGMGKTLNVAGTEVEIICAEGAVLSFNAPVLEYFATRGFTDLVFTAGNETGAINLASLFALNLNAPIKAYFENGALKVFAGDTEVA